MPGIKPKGKVGINWSPSFAYAIGLITTDGNLSPDGRHMNFTSKDLDLVKIFKKCLGIDNKIGMKARGGETLKEYNYVQFGDILFYRFLLGLGLTPAKSRNMGAIEIPKKYFFDFLRGHFDGDGSFYSYYDPRWKSSFMFYTVFISASIAHIKWLQDRIWRVLKIKGHITHGKNSVVYQLKYAKGDSLKVLKKMYYSENIYCLERKRLKIKKALNIIGLNFARVL